MTRDDPSEEDASGAGGPPTDPATDVEGVNALLDEALRAVAGRCRRATPADAALVLHAVGDHCDPETGDTAARDAFLIEAAGRLLDVVGAEDLFWFDVYEQLAMPAGGAGDPVVGTREGDDTRSRESPGGAASGGSGREWRTFDRVAGGAADPERLAVAAVGRTPSSDSPPGGGGEGGGDDEGGGEDEGGGGGGSGDPVAAGPDADARGDHRAEFGALARDLAAVVGRRVAVGAPLEASGDPTDPPPGAVPADLLRKHLGTVAGFQEGAVEVPNNHARMALARVVADIARAPLDDRDARWVGTRLRSWAALYARAEAAAARERLAPAEIRQAALDRETPGERYW